MSPSGEGVKGDACVSLNEPPLSILHSPAWNTLASCRTTSCGGTGNLSLSPTRYREAETHADWDTTVGWNPFYGLLSEEKCRRLCLSGGRDEHRDGHHEMCCSVTVYYPIRNFGKERIDDTTRGSRQRGDGLLCPSARGRMETGGRDAPTNLCPLSAVCGGWSPGGYLYRRRHHAAGNATGHYQ